MIDEAIRNGATFRMLAGVPPPVDDVNNVSVPKFFEMIEHLQRVIGEREEARKRLTVLEGTAGEMMSEVLAVVIGLYRNDETFRLMAQAIYTAQANKVEEQ